jgi:hypothetical protein
MPILVFWHQHKIPMSSSGLSRGSRVQHAPELADRWMVGTSPDGLLGRLLPTSEENLGKRLRRPPAPPDPV